MAEDIVIRIEDNGGDGRNSSANDAALNKITMEDLFGEKPWWTEPEWINNLVGETERISYPEKKGDALPKILDADINDYMLQIIEQLVEIERNTSAIVDEIGAISYDQNIPNAPNNNDDQLTQGLNRINSAIQGLAAQITISGIVNNPINTVTTGIRNFGDFASGIVSNIGTQVLAGILTPILGPAGPAIAQIVGTMAGAAVKQFFDTIAAGIEALFSYVDRQVKELALFSPEITYARAEREIQVRQFQFSTAQNYGETFSEIYRAQTDTYLAIENLKVALFKLISPVAVPLLEAVTNIVDILNVIATGVGEFKTLESLTEFSQSTIGPALIKILDFYTVGLASMIDEVSEELKLARKRAQQLDEQLVNNQILDFFQWKQLPRNPPPQPFMP